MQVIRAARAVCFLLCTAAAIPCSGQQPANDNFAGDDIVVPRISGVFVPPLPHVPFSASVQIESQQILGDGSVNEFKTIEHIARDSQGRTWTERRRLVAAAFEGQPPLQMIQIYDPATGVSSRLDPYTLIARQTTNAGQPVAPADAIPMADTASAVPPIRSGDLGSRTVLGMTVKGIRQTKVNNSVDEFWYLPELSIYLARKHETPTLKETIEVTHLERSEPDASLFVIPAGYRIAATLASVGSPPLVPVPGQDNVYRIGNGVSAPRVTYTVDPQYTEAARAAKFQGICVVSVVVDTHGGAQDVHIERSLRKDLDEKAVEAVKRYRFTPAMYQGHPVAVKVSIEVNFRLY